MNPNAIPPEHADLDAEIREMLEARAGPAAPQPQPGRRRRSLTAPAVGVALAVAAAAAAVVLVAPLGGPPRPAGHPTTTNSGASCAAAVDWRGATYVGTRVRRPVTLGATAIGRGTLPGCSDTPGGTARRQHVQLASVSGVPSSQAVAVRGEARTLYIAPGFFPQLPGTALHDVVYGTSPAVPDERGNDCAGARSTTLRAVVQSAYFGILTVRLEGRSTLPRETSIFSDARTKVSGGGSAPHVSPGNEVDATVLVCRHPNDARFLKLVATWLAIRR